MKRYKALSRFMSAYVENGLHAALTAAAAYNHTTDVRITITGHSFASGDLVCLRGTAHYDGVWPLTANTTTNYIFIPATYVAETFTAAMTADRVVVAGVEREYLPGPYVYMFESFQYRPELAIIRPFETTIATTIPTADRTYTVPDAGADAAFMMSAGDQTITGTKTIAALKTAALSIGTAGAEVAVTATPAELNLALHGIVRWWIPADGTLQALITSITDATATKTYTIMVPPGYYEAAALGTSPLLLKPFINLNGAGGAGRVTVFHNIGVSFLDAAMTSGVQRLRLDGIRFETCPIIMTASSHQMSVVLNDCPINSVSSIKFTGTSYSTYSTLELRNLNIDVNTTANLYKYCRVSFWQCQLLGLYFEDADAYFFACDISADCNAVNAGTAGGWFEFNHCKIDQMTVGVPASESVLATFGVGGSENIQVHGAFTGETAPGSVTAFTRMRAGTQYFCHNNGKLYVKTADVGTNTWVVVGSQS